MYVRTDISAVYVRMLPSQPILTGEQHSPALHDGIFSSMHLTPSPHPPLSMAHEYSQYGKPVSLHTLHSDPGGQLYIEQTMENKPQSVRKYTHMYIKYTIHDLRKGLTAWVLIPCSC